MKDQQYYSYDLHSKKTAQITQGTGCDFGSDLDEDRVTPRPPVGIAGWLPDDEGFLIYDNFDIWKIDPAGIRIPENVTRGYGRINGIKLRLLNDNSSMVCQENEMLVLAAFKPDDKQTGFFKLRLDQKLNPEKLRLDSCLFYRLESQSESYGLNTLRPVKASNANRWLVTKMKSNESPGLYVTSDFRKYKLLNNLQPHKAYNWLTSELVSFTREDGIASKGVLYKPEDFTSTKKYPVIFYYYEKLSNNLHGYLNPAMAGDGINIPWLVSRGYLVFTPDIHYNVGNPGQSAYNAVVGAAKYLAQLPWVDSKHMGICGQSFGGYETHYITTHSNLFAAAIGTSGVTNLISFYGQLSGKLYSRKVGQEFSEVIQFRMGATLWERPDLYIKNSPVFNADKVTTPLLMMNNKGDMVVPWMQGLELFTALETVTKKVWMLQYDEGGHGLFKEKDKIDYTIRSTQFLDHYLKGFPPRSG